jgi:hypothetical protein
MASDNVLDDALDDFGLAAELPKLPLTAQLSTPGPSGLGASLPQRLGNAAPSTSGTQQKQQPASYQPLGKATGAAAAFDPLRKGKHAAQKKASSSSKAPAPPKAGQPGSSSSGAAPSTTAAPASQAVPGAPVPAVTVPAAGSSDAAVDEDLRKGVAQLMAELARADAAGGAGGDAQQPELPHEREIASTLAALAAAVPAGPQGSGRGAGGEPAGAHDAAVASMAEKCAHRRCPCAQPQYPCMHALPAHSRDCSEGFARPELHVKTLHDEDFLHVAYAA